MSSVRRTRGRATYIAPRQQQQQQYSSHFESGGGGSQSLNLTQDNFPALPNSDHSAAVLQVAMKTGMIKPPSTVMTPESSPVLHGSNPAGDVPLTTAMYATQTHPLQAPSPIMIDQQQSYLQKGQQAQFNSSNSFPYAPQMSSSMRMDVHQPTPDEYTKMMMANSQQHMMYQQQMQPHVPYMNQQQMYPQVMYDGVNSQFGSQRYIMVPAGHPSSGNYMQPPMYGQPPLWMCPAPQQQQNLFEPKFSSQIPTPPDLPLVIPSSQGDSAAGPQTWLSTSSGNSEDKAVDATTTLENKDTQTSPQQKDVVSPRKPRALTKNRKEDKTSVSKAIEKKLAIKDDNWEVPNAKPEELQGWETPAKAEKKIPLLAQPVVPPKICSNSPPEKRQAFCTQKETKLELKNWRADNQPRNETIEVVKEEVRELPTSNDMSDPQSYGFDFQKANEEAKAFRQAELALLTPIVKDVYQENPVVTNLSDEEVEGIRSSKNISVHFPKPEELSPIFKSEASDKDFNQTVIPKPVTSFKQAYGDYPEILSEVQKQGFSDPTPIQSQLWPCIMKGMDVVGIAQTGSGKTLGFLLPAFIHIEKQVKPRSERTSPTVLILAPTRELAQQIHKEVSKYSYKNIWSVCIYGGSPRHEQVDILKRNPEIVIATPGRLNDLVMSNDIDLKEVSFLVLDEADEMLNQGFEPQINKTLNRVREDRQTILTSATWPQSVRRMAKNYTTDPVMVVIGTVELRATTSVKQNIEFLADDEAKHDWLVNFLNTKMTETDKLIVFVGRKSFADHLSSELSLLNWSCVCIHGGLPQSERDRAIQNMQTGEIRVLIASDVVARGIDIECVSYIINYDVPKSSEMYIHRIGRTGRAGRTGESFTLMTRRDWNKAQDLVDVLTNAGQEVPEELIAMAERFKNKRSDRGGGGGGGGGRSFYNRGGGDGGGYGGGQRFGDQSNFGNQRSAPYSNGPGYADRGQRDYSSRQNDYSDRRHGGYSAENSQEFSGYRGQSDFSNRGQNEYSNRGQNNYSNRGQNSYSSRGQNDYSGNANRVQRNGYNRDDGQYGRGRNRY